MFMSTLVQTNWLGNHGIWTVCVCQWVGLHIYLYVCEYSLCIYIMHCTFVLCMCRLFIVNDLSGASSSNPLSEHSLAVHKELLCSVTPYLLNSDTVIRISEWLEIRVQLHSITSLPFEKQTDFQIEPESLKCESVCYSFQKKRKKKKLGISYWSSAQENKMKCGCVLCRQHREPLIIRLFILLLKSVHAEYTQSSTHGRGAERFGVCDPKTKWVIKLPLWLCVPAQLWLIFARENKVVYFICMLKDALFLSLSLLQHHNYLKCEMLFRYS